MERRPGLLLATLIGLIYVAPLSGQGGDESRLLPPTPPASDAGDFETGAVNLPAEAPLSADESSLADESQASRPVDAPVRTVVPEPPSVRRHLAGRLPLSFASVAAFGAAAFNCSDDQSAAYVATVLSGVSVGAAIWPTMDPAIRRRSFLAIANGLLAGFLGHSSTQVDSCRPTRHVVSEFAMWTGAGAATSAGGILVRELWTVWKPFTRLASPPLLPVIDRRLERS